MPAKHTPKGHVPEAAPAGDHVPRRTCLKCHLHGRGCAREVGEAPLQLRGRQGEVDAAEAGRGVVPARAAGGLRAPAAVIAVLVVICSVPVPATSLGRVSTVATAAGRMQGGARTRCRRRQRCGRPCRPARRPALRPGPHPRRQAARKQQPPPPLAASAAKLPRPQRQSHPRSRRPGNSMAGRRLSIPW